MDRQEKASEASSTSAIQQVEQDLGVPVLSVVRLRHLVAFVAQQQQQGRHLEIDLEAVRLYRAQFGVEY